LVNVFRSERAEPDLTRELASHLTLLEDEYRRRGMTPKDACLAARRALGSIEHTKDLHRDARSFVWLDDAQRDLRYAVRTLCRTPGFTAVAVLTLALGIGANTAIFTVVNSLLLRTLPVSEPQRLVTLVSSGDDSWTYAVWDQIRARAAFVDGAFAWSMQRFNLAQGGEMAPVDGLFVSGDFFRTLGVPAIIGRTFTAADDVRGGGPDGPVAVISYGLWQRRFGGALTAIGAPIVVERVPFTIVGVTPREFFGVEVGRAFDVVLPIGAEPLIRGQGSLLDVRRAYWLTVMLRLKPGQSLDRGATTLHMMQPQIRESALPPQGAEDFLKDPFMLVPAATGTSGLRERYQQPLLAILVVVLLVLLIACANLANLLLARATARRHEVSVRLALGASRWRLARQLLVESLVLASAGAVVGLILADVGSRALVAQLSTSVARVALDLSLDWRVLAFTGTATVATALLFGVTPAFQATRIEPTFGLHASSWRRRSDRHDIPGRRLVVVQVGLSLMLVVAAGLFVRTFQRLASVPLGFDRDRVLLVNVDATRAVVDPADRLSFYRRLVLAVEAVPGVAKAAASEITPVSGRMWNFPADVPGGSVVPDRERRVRGNKVTPGWFATYGTVIHAGRDIAVRDTKSAPRVALVNEAFVRKFLPGQNAIGRTFVEPAIGGGQPVTRTIIGVVGDAVYRSLRDDPQPTIYTSLLQQDRAGGSINISVRSSGGPPNTLAPSVAAALTAADPNLAFSFRALQDQVNVSLAQERLVAMLSGFFGGVALLLAAVGLYGVTSYLVTRRRAEIGIRLALGAQRTDVLGLVLGRSLLMTAGGIVFGLAGAAAVTRYLEGMLFGVTPLDLTTFAAVPLLFAVVAMLASYAPARRAMNVDPAASLRCE
jgi:predicted permease